MPLIDSIDKLPPEAMKKAISLGLSNEEVAWCVKIADKGKRQYFCRSKLRQFILVLKWGKYYLRYPYDTIPEDSLAPWEIDDDDCDYDDSERIHTGGRHRSPDRSRQYHNNKIFTNKGSWSRGHSKKDWGC